MLKQIHIFGGGTFNHVRSHLALAAPAFGGTARKLDDLIEDGWAGEWLSRLHLTKMADPRSSIITNADLEKALRVILTHRSAKAIIFNAAVCDFEGSIDNVSSGPKAERLRTANGNKTMTLTPAQKIVRIVKELRPDIWLATFKTTCNKTDSAMKMAGAEHKAYTGSDAVLVNDVGTYSNIVITHNVNYLGDDRAAALRLLLQSLPA